MICQVPSKGKSRETPVRNLPNVTYCQPVKQVAFYIMIMCRYYDTKKSNLTKESEVKWDRDQGLQRSTFVEEYGNSLNISFSSCHMWSERKETDLFSIKLATISWPAQHKQISHYTSKITCLQCVPLCQIDFSLLHSSKGSFLRAQCSRINLPLMIH